MNQEKLPVTKSKKKVSYNFYLMLPYLLVLIILIVMPMIFILIYSITKRSADFPIYSVTFSNYKNFFTNATYFKSLGLSIYFAFISTLVCLLISYPLAYFIAKRKASTQAILILLITSPMWVNSLLRVLALKQVLDNSSILVQLIQVINPDFGGILGTNFAVVAGMVYVYIPYMVLPIYTILSKLDYRLVEASIDLGATKAQTFKNITLPLSIPGVLSGVTIVFLCSATTIVISDKLGLGKLSLIGNIIDSEFKNSNWGFGSAISVVLLVIIMGIMILTSRISKVEKESV